MRAFVSILASVWLAAVSVPAGFAAETAGAGNGDIYFTTVSGTRPPEGRHSVAPGDKIGVCLKLREQNIPLFQNMDKGAIGYRLVLEDNQDPPHVLIIAPGNRLELMKPDADGCLAGEFQIPANVVSGVYQVADLLLAFNDQSYYSLRDYLYDFTQVDELDVKNPASDTTPPRLIAITKYPHWTHKVKVSKIQFKISLGQVFQFEETGSGIDKDSIRVRYRITLDGETRGYATARCKARPHQSFNCKVELVRPVVEWSARDVGLALDSISLQDKAGNRLVLDEAGEWEAQAHGLPTAFDFPPQDPKGPIPERYLLKKDSLY